MRDSFAEKTKFYLKDQIGRYKGQLASYSDSETLNRRKWLSVRDNPAETQRLAMSHGQTKVMEWAQRNSLIDSMEVK